MELHVIEALRALKVVLLVGVPLVQRELARYVPRRQFGRGGLLTRHHSRMLLLPTSCRESLRFCDGLRDRFLTYSATFRVARVLRCLTTSELNPSIFEIAPGLQPSTSVMRKISRS